LFIPSYFSLNLKTTVINMMINYEEDYVVSIIDNFNILDIKSAGLIFKITLIKFDSLPIPFFRDRCNL